MKSHNFSLQPFKPVNFDLQITGEVARENHILTVHYILKGDLGKIEIPPSGNTPTRKDGLWETTCFEFFLGRHYSSNYWEFNLSPNGDWNVYRFEDYRKTMELENTVHSLPFNVLRDSNALFLGLELDLHELDTTVNENFDISITTVIKQKDGDISYWAVKHCGKEADFHLRESFLFYL
ncbi:MAG: DOMON-like domain-containing protein [Cyanobacteria bacterium J06633_8]